MLTEFTLYYYSLKKTKHNILTFTLPCCSPSNADFASDLCSINVSVRGYTKTMAVTWHEHQTKAREFIYEEMLAYVKPLNFNNFMCIINLCIFILKFHDQMYRWTIKKNVFIIFLKTSFYCIRTPVF